MSFECSLLNRWNTTGMNESIKSHTQEMVPYQSSNLIIAYQCGGKHDVSYYYDNMQLRMRWIERFQIVKTDRVVPFETHCLNLYSVSNF